MGNLYGTVVNLSYNPVSNAEVVVDSSITNTLSNGTYSFINLPSGEKRIKITSTAHTSAYRKVTFSGGQSANAGIAILANLDSKVTPIPSSGGTATNTNGSIKMVFPNGAFPSPLTQIVLTTVPKVAAPYDPPESYQFISYIVYAKPEETTLSVAAKLSVPNLTSVTNEAVAFYRFNPNNYSWEYFGDGHASAETQTIDVDTIYMGWIAAIMPINPAPGKISGVVKNSSTLNPIPGANVWTMTSYAVSDSFGAYTLNYVPTGVTTVYASALSYQLYTSSPVSVESLQTKTLDIYMTPVDQGNIAGTVNELYGSVLNQARVVGSLGGITYTDGYGRYTLYNTPTGPTNVTAYANDHISSTETVTVVGGTTISDVNFNLPFVGPSSTYEFTFETSEEGFTTEADSLGHNFWHRQFYDVNPAVRPQNYFNSSHGAVSRKVYLKDDGTTSVDGRIPAPPHGGNYYFWYGQTSPATSEASYIGIEAYDDTAEGSGGISSNGLGNYGTLESPALDLTGYTFGNLSFWTWWEIEGKNPATGYDSMYVFVSKSPYSIWDLIGYLNPYEDPAKTITVSGEAYTSGGFNQPGVWVKHNFDLTSYAGNSIKIKFMFNTYDFHFNGFRGWFIDDVKVENSQFGISSSPEILKTIYYPSTPREPR